MTKELTKITEYQKQALKATGYDQLLGESLNELSKVFINKSVEELADIYNICNYDSKSAIEYYQYKSYLETIVNMIEYLTGLTHGYSFIGEPEEFEKLKTINITLEE
ncbi:MAG: hypothetical protein HAW60_05955 [Bdellovibrionales bacterium]|nr:hypothetical protein [Bdellovibrionales bacterium]